MAYGDWRKLNWLRGMGFSDSIKVPCNFPLIIWKLANYCPSNLPIPFYSFIQMSQPEEKSNCTIPLKILSGNQREWRDLLIMEGPGDVADDMATSIPVCSGSDIMLKYPDDILVFGKNSKVKKALPQCCPLCDITTSWTM